MFSKEQILGEYSNTRTTELFNGFTIAEVNAMEMKVLHHLQGALGIAENEIETRSWTGYVVLYCHYLPSVDMRG